MGAIFVFVLVSAVVLASLYLVYKWLLSRENQPTANRVLLLSFYLIAPLVALSLMRGGAGVSHPEIAFFGLELAGVQDAVPVADAPAVPWAGIAVALWLGGVVLCLLRLLVQLVAIRRLARACEPCEIDGVKVFVCDRKLAPFSLGESIFISRADMDQDCAMILCHERAHIARRHSADLIVAALVSAVEWFNPAAWLIMDELKTVHEYEADRAVLQSGADARAYQLLLTKKAVGGSFPAIANSLNHSKLKKRITMMQKSQPGRWRLVRALALLPAVAAAAFVINTPAVASTLDGISASAFAAGKPADKVNQNSAIAAIAAAENQPGTETQDVPDRIASFPGGDVRMMQFLVENIHFPENVDFDGRKRCVVSFTIGADGKVSDPQVILSTGIEALDAEALRVVSTMPDFEPAIENGTPIATSYTLPVVFSYTPSKED